MKNMQAVANQVGGYDLVVDKDAGNPVRILTGNKKRSLKFWKELEALCNNAIINIYQNEHDRESK